MSTSGVYGIFNLVNNKVLVGSTNNLNRRWKEHRSYSRFGKHPNPHFQAAWDKYGETFFEFRVLEKCSVDVLISRENSWMEYWHSKDDSYGYNMQEAGSVSSPMKGKHHTEESLKKMSASHKGCIPWNKGIPRTPEVLAKMRPFQFKKGHIPATRGRPMDERLKKLLISINTGHKASNETKLKMSLALKGRKPWNKGIPRSPETSAKIAATFARPDIKAKMSSAQVEHQRLHPQSPEQRARHSAFMKARYAERKEAKTINSSDSPFNILQQRIA
jgi:group I intron endonuclease